MLTVSAATALTSDVPAPRADTADTYVVLYVEEALPAGVDAHIRASGGEVVAAYAEIGVVIAKSRAGSFESRVKRDRRIADVSPTGSAAAGRRRLPRADDKSSNGVIQPLSDKQWDMRQIHADEAHRVTLGSRDVLVGDVDTGLDYSHPNLRTNIDLQNSVSCIGGAPNQTPSAWFDDNGHGTHTAGTIAATPDGGGMAGVAPGVRIAAIKAGDADGLFFPESVVCAFMWAGSHGMDVTNNSYFVDPWLHYCLEDAKQRAIWTAETRAIGFALRRGVTVVASAGNENDDLDNPTIDRVSPDFPPGTARRRRLDRQCFKVPAMVPGVYTVSAVGSLARKSFSSSYGKSWVRATAPGGDSRYQMTRDSPSGRILSTYPPAAISNLPADRSLRVCGRGGCATYAYLQGASMAAPHVAGVAALIASRYGRLSAEDMGRRLDGATDPLPCPGDPFDQADLGPDGRPAHCSGSPEFNSFYGHGQINALKAVSQ